MMSSAPLQTCKYHTLEDLQVIVPEWKALLEKYPLATTFSTPEWLIAWWENFGKNEQLLAVGFFDESQFVGLALLSLSTVRIARLLPLKRLRLLGDGSKDSDNLDILVLPGYEQAVANALVDFLTRERGSWDFAEFHTLPPTSPVGQALQGILEEKGWFVIESQRPASAITLPSTWEEYLAALSSKERGKISYYSRRIEKKYQSRLYRCENSAALPRYLETLFRLHQQHWQSAGHGGSFKSPERRQFYFDLGSALLEQNLLEFWLLDLNGETVAAQFGFRYGETVSQLQEGYDRDYSSDSVGYILRAWVIRELIGQGVRRYDFLGGLDESKKRWGAQAGHYVDLNFARTSSAGAAYLKARSSAAEGKLWLRDNLPAPVWKLLHNVNVSIRGGKKLLPPEKAKQNSEDDSGAPLQ